jgi:preprotein translocase subunit YajC
MLIRPQQKKMKQHQELLGNLKKGDRVITTGGLIGTVENTNGEREITLEIADGIKVQVVRAMISEVMNKTAGNEGAPSKKFEAIKGGAKKASTTKKK